MRRIGLTDDSIAYVEAEGILVDSGGGWGFDHIQQRI